MNALVFLYKHVLKRPFDQKINAVRASRKINIPVVMSREEVAQIIALMEGVPQLIVKLLYGSGLHIMETVRLRVQDIDYELKCLVVRSGKGAKDRVTTFPISVIPLLQNHLAKVRVIHNRDLDPGHGEVYMPNALARKYPNAAKEWNWQYVFPARNRAIDPRSGSAFIRFANPGISDK